jgi:hypothetical protein
VKGTDDDEEDDEASGDILKCDVQHDAEDISLQHLQEWADVVHEYPDRDTSPQQDQSCCAAAMQTNDLAPQSTFDSVDDIDEEEEDAILGGRYWRHISPAMTASLDRLENIGDVACTLLHGHVVCLVAQRVRGTKSTDTSEPVLSEIAARVIVQSWSTRPNLSKLLRVDYQGLVDLFVDMITEAIADPG